MELIIVITILAILATIAFMSFQWYMKWARDSNRVTTITQIHKWIGTFQTTTWNVPNIDNQIGTGTLSWNPVTYVGYIWDTVSKLIKLSKTPIDPATNTNYIYGVDITKTKYQVATIVEDLQTNKWHHISQTYADWWLKARVLWNYQWMLTYSWKIYNIPSLIITFSWSTSQDLLASNTNYVIDKTDNLPYLTTQAKQLNTLTPTQILQKQTNTWATLIVTWITLPTDASTWNSSSWTLQTAFWYNIDVIWQMLFWDKYFTEIKGNTVTGWWVWGGWWANYPWCDTSDITIWSYTIAACNVGTNTAWLTSASYGNYFQWWNNWGTPSGTITPNTTVVNASANGPWNYYNSTTFIGWAGLLSPYDWTSPQNNNLWWDTTNTSIARQWPCATGYHVPSQNEWSALVTAGWWWTNGTAMQTALKLPFAGYHHRFDGIMFNQSSYGYYWSSSPNGTYGYRLYFGSSDVTSSDVSVRAFGFSVRCFKN